MSSEVPIGRRARVSSLQREELMKQFLDDHKGVMQQWQRLTTGCSGVIRRDRRRWPELLPHLVYVYNTTPHATTGVTPFSLMFGRKERIPLDQLFGKNDTDWEQDYVQKQADMFERAREVVTERMQRIAAKNKERVDVKLSKNTIHPDVGSIVYLIKCAFTQRHKLQNKYFDEMYVVYSMAQFRKRRLSCSAG